MSQKCWWGSLETVKNEFVLTNPVPHGGLKLPQHLLEGQYQGITNPGGSWNAVMITSFYKWERSQGEEVLFWILCSPAWNGWWEMWSSRGALTARTTKWSLILRKAGKVHRKLTTLAFRRAAFGLLRDLPHTVSWDKALEGRGTQESWLVLKDHLYLKDHLLQAQEWLPQQRGS